MIANHRAIAGNTRAVFEPRNRIQAFVRPGFHMNAAMKQPQRLLATSEETGQRHNVQMRQKFPAFRSNRKKSIGNLEANV